MNVIDKLIEQARKEPKKVIFPESKELRILQAARKIADLGIAYPLLVGNPKVVAEDAKENGIDLSGIEILDNEDETLKQSVIEAFLAVEDMYSVKTLNRKFKTALDFAAAMVRVGRADCLAAGVSYTTGEVLLAAQMYIGLEKDVNTPSSLGICEIPGYAGSEGDMLVVSDCAVNVNPSSEELADIAIATANTVTAILGWEPRIAMLSYSTKGSGSGELVDKVVKSIEIAKQKRPDLKIDGEFQLDAAIIPEVAARKVKVQSEVAGRANIIVFPDLNAGNIGVKLLQIFGHALAHGPLLQGFSKPVTDFSRSAPVEEMVGNLIMLVVRAQHKR